MPAAFGTPLRRRPCWLPPLLVALGLILGAPALPGSTAHGQITAIEEADGDEWEDDTPFFLYGVTVFGVGSTVDMQDLNEALVAANEVIATQGSIGIQYDPVTRAGGFGVGLRAVIGDRYVVQADWERMSATTGVGGVTSESTVDVPVDAVTGSLGYDFLESSTARFGFSLGLGWYRSAARQVLTEALIGWDEDELYRINLNGSTTGLMYAVFFETEFTPRLYVGATAGYRQARIGDLEYRRVLNRAPGTDADFISVPIAETDVSDDTRSRLLAGGDSLDWTGFYGRAGITLYFNASEF